jgi:CheY-like chemotaxis protein
MMGAQSRVLIVDDEVEAREALAEMLRAKGYLADIFDGGSRALEFLRAGPRPDVILLDLLLRRDMNGWEFLDLVKANPQLKNIPVIAMSGAELSPELRRQCKAEAFLAKPLHPHVLLVALEQYRALPS